MSAAGIGAANPPDEVLAEKVRAGDRRAFGELWLRYAQDARRISRRLVPVSDVEDLVAEGYVRILDALLRGSGPVGPFRPYLYQVLRNLSIEWSRVPREIPDDDLDRVPDPRTLVDPFDIMFHNRTLARAFGSLPERWQHLLWMAEVEDLPPSQIAMLLGMRANSVAAATYRARVGLRRAWAEAHHSEEQPSPECAWVLDHSRGLIENTLPISQLTRALSHLSECRTCPEAIEEFRAVAGWLGVIRPRDDGGPGRRCPE